VILTSLAIPYYNVRNSCIRKGIVAVAKITSKGQITIPVRIRALLGVGAGDRVEFVEIEKGQVLVVPATRSIRELNGMFRGRVKKPVTIEEMDEAIAQRASESR
jgi:antitoxin PrlF